MYLMKDIDAALVKAGGFMLLSLVRIKGGSIITAESGRPSSAKRSRGQEVKEAEHEIGASGVAGYCSVVDLKDLNQLPPRDLQDPINTERAIKRSIIRHQERTNPTFDDLLDDIDLDTLPSQISELRSAPPETDEVFFKVGRTTGWTAGVSNSCRSVYFAVYNETVSIKAGKDEHNYANYGACLMWCFLGVRPDSPFSRGGDSGSLVFDRFGKAVGLLFCGTNERKSRTGSYVEVPDISSVVSLKVVLRDIGLQLELSEIKFANGTEVYG